MYVLLLMLTPQWKFLLGHLDFGGHGHRNTGSKAGLTDSHAATHAVEVVVTPSISRTWEELSRHCETLWSEVASRCDTDACLYGPQEGTALAAFCSVQLNIDNDSCFHT